jgi:DNA (cytosine-5)-methyltransferase 1
MLTAVDLFAGIGGSSEGARLAGVKVLAAANHWRHAVEIHKLNHPESEHFLQDLNQANFHAWPDFDIMMASPACQGHARARGRERPHHDACRSTAWAVVACAEAKQPKVFVVENVPEFEKWTLYPEWRNALDKLGYAMSSNIIDAADLGVPQHRRRVFVVGVRKDLSPVPIHIPSPAQTHRPAFNIIDWSAGKWSYVAKPGRSEATLRRYENGRRDLGERFLMAYFGKEKGGRPLDKPMGSVLTRDRYALVDGDRMRMFTKHEYLRACGFREDYILPRQHKAAVFMLGNCVSPPVMQHVLTSIQNFQWN